MTTDNNEPATDEVNRTAQAILDATEAGDSAKLISHYAADAVLATAGRPPARGIEAVSKVIRKDLGDPNFRLSVAGVKTEVASSDDLAYRRVTLDVTYTNPHTKQVEKATATNLSVMRKQADESWKVVEDFEVRAAGPD